MLRLGVLASGRGTNLQALLDAAAGPGFPASVAVVVCDVDGAGALARAAAQGVPATVVPRRPVAQKPAFEAAIDAALREARVDLVCLAGFMRILSADFVARWPDRILNIHPSLLPSFPGLDTHARALAAGVRIHGCTVHLVRAAVDSGPILVQAAVPVLADDDADSLAARVLAAEHQCYPLAIRLIAEGRVRIDGDRAVIRPSGGALADPIPKGVLISPSS